MVVIWGLNFVVMKTGLKGLSPMMLGALRFALAAFPLILFVRPPALPWRWIAAYGLAQGLGQFGLLFVALQAGMPAGMASLVIQTQASSRCCWPLRCCANARAGITGSGWAWPRWAWP